MGFPPSGRVPTTRACLLLLHLGRVRWAGGRSCSPGILFVGEPLDHVEQHEQHDYDQRNTQ
jgi:hypothetical protein